MTDGVEYVYIDCFDYQSTCGAGVHFLLDVLHPELTEDHVLTSVYVKIFRTITRNAVNKSV